jgi:cytochrome bd-type quinol oxidase subunit 2
LHLNVAFTMIQRIQTVYLILVALLMVALYIWFPALQSETGETVLDRSALWIMIPIFTSVGLAILSILNFKKRQLQFVINRLNIILNFVLLGVFVYRSLSVSGETLVSMKGIGVLIPVISIVFLVLANKAIKRDEDLVKSVDRLR